MSDKFEHAGLIIKIEQDLDPLHPRTDEEPLGHMFCIHRRYNIGDKHHLSVEELMEIASDPKNVCLPIFAYEHSGITISTSAFSCPWDSGQIGIIYMTEDEVKKEYNGDIDRAIKGLKSSVEYYDQYLTGDVWGYTIEDKEGNVLDSCWGFYGYQYCEIEAKSSAEYFAKQEKEAENYYLNKL